MIFQMNEPLHPSGLTLARWLWPFKVALWRRDVWGRHTIAVWGWGTAVYDAKRPPRMTSSERSARCRMKKREKDMKL
jgi:hypothetical protein